MSEERESENAQNVAVIDEGNTVEVGDTSNSSAKITSILQNVQMSSEIVVSGEKQRDHDLTVAEKDCVMTSTEEGMDDQNASVNEKLQLMTEKGLEQIVGDESLNLEEILCGIVAAVCGRNKGSEKNIGTEDVNQGSQPRTTSMCPGLTMQNLEGSCCEASCYERDEVDSILQDELSGSRVTSTLVKGLWPIYSKRRSSVLGGHEATPCKSIRFGVTDTVGALESGNLSRSCITEVSAGLEKVILPVAAFRLWRPLKTDELMIKMEGSTNVRQVMVWFEFRQ